ncbi:hypothetical protein F1559_003377 [Cyanidiococcus yangmingshanensis]|uniref:Uncharacterized protein n=1 Tax=Cyanidiococcus yangmingshanensis TaxID=2690220 RepID=A0A7J7IDG0_9RHOD|nr:hypothetical protein F1559_003377 [Cyanidiococcus yangmingshanensis]
MLSISETQTFANANQIESWRLSPRSTPLSRGAVVTSIRRTMIRARISATADTILPYSRSLGSWRFQPFSLRRQALSWSTPKQDVDFAAAAFLRSTMYEQ